MSVDVQVRQCDHEGRNAAPAVEGPEMRAPELARDRPAAVAWKHRK
jgi:hypothetical protein